MITARGKTGPELLAAIRVMRAQRVRGRARGITAGELLDVLREQIKLGMLDRAKPVTIAGGGPVGHFTITDDDRLVLWTLDARRSLDAAKAVIDRGPR